MTSMGSGSKVCVDLTSEDRIQDRAVSSGLFSKGIRKRLNRFFVRKKMLSR